MFVNVFLCLWMFDCVFLSKSRIKVYICEDVFICDFEKFLNSGISENISFFDVLICFFLVEYNVEGYFEGI